MFSLRNGLTSERKVLQVIPKIDGNHGGAPERTWLFVLELRSPPFNFCIVKGFIKVAYERNLNNRNRFNV